MKISKRTVAAGTVGAVAASGLGLLLLGAPAALAATADDSTTSSGPAAESGGRVQAIKDALAGLVSGGTLTQSQADEVATTLDSSDALRGGGPGGHGGGRVVDLETAATTIGLSAEDLRTALQAEGATLVSVAAEHDVTEQTLVDALVEAATTRLAQQVSDGVLTQAEADERIALLPEEVTAAVGRELPAGPGGPGGPGGRGGPSGTTPDAAPDAIPDAAPGSTSGSTSDSTTDETAYRLTT